jgi:eukaryotic translation initiation factor 2C
MKERFLAWHRIALPGRSGTPSRWPLGIVFYRDGVGEGQYGMVLDQELPKIKKAWNEAKSEMRATNTGPPADFEPYLIMVIVTKRHHTRLYPQQAKDETNLQSGTLVDSTIISPRFEEFYLQSHHSALGTARCTYNIIIHNSNRTQKEHIEELVSP